MKRPILAGLLFALLSIGPFPAQAAHGRKTKVAVSKEWAFRLNLPKGSTWKETGKGTYELDLANPKGADWIQSMVLDLEVCRITPDGPEKPVDGDPDAQVSQLTLGNLSWEKAVDGSAGAGHTMITVSYTALTVKHQYHLVGILSATNPELMENGPKHWDPQKSAEKVFDGVLTGFRTLDLP